MLRQVGLSWVYLAGTVAIGSPEQVVFESLEFWDKSPQNPTPRAPLAIRRSGVILVSPSTVPHHAQASLSDSSCCSGGDRHFGARPHETHESWAADGPRPPYDLQEISRLPNRTPPGSLLRRLLHVRAWTVRPLHHDRRGHQPARLVQILAGRPGRYL